MKYITALTAFLALQGLVALEGCDGGTTDSKGYHKEPHPADTAPMEYDCTKEQMDKVEHESTWCDKNTGYFRSYCYGAAIIRNCTKKRDFSQWQKGREASDGNQR